ncbi:acyltransferase family protein [soil metagenome]
MTTANTTAPHRLYFLDWLRIIAFGLLVLYHVGMYYVRWEFHVKSPFAGPGLEPWMMLSSPWRLCLLFIVSGAATSFMLARGASGALLRSRTRRLLLPLACGMVLIVPPQSYFEVVQKYAYAGSYLDFLGLYFTGYKGFCASAGHCLILPTWNHLWFLPYLWVYTLMLWLVLKLRPNALDALARFAARALQGAWLMLLPIAVIIAVRLVLYARFPTTHAFFGDWFAHAMYAGMFVTGAVFARLAGIWTRLADWRWPALLVAFACWVVGWVLMASLGAQFPGPARLLMYASFQWAALVAAIGFARHHLNADHRWRQQLTEAVFPVYIFHQTWIILLSQALLPLRWPPLFEGLVLIAATFVLSWASYELVRRVGVLRPWFGLGSAASQRAPLQRAITSV